MNVVTIAQQAAVMKGWPAQPDGTGGLRMEIPTRPGRSQVVNVVTGKDGDGDTAAFIWSRAGDTNVLRDVMAILRLNADLTYGKVALQGNDVVIVHALYDATAEINGVGKALYWVAMAADDLEARTYGSDTL